MENNVFSCFDEKSLNDVKMGNYSENNYNKVIALAECFIK